MAETPSNMLPLGTAMPEFGLPDFEGRQFSSSTLAGRPVVVVFMCNHCPFVKHIADVLGERARDYGTLGVEVVGINANDVGTHPGDAPDRMKEFAVERGLSFPYLVDETQEIATAFRAACTPDFFLFDGSHSLVYRGQFDGSRPGNDVPVTGADLTAAVKAVAAGKPVTGQQRPSVGCNIKWKPGNEPAPVRFG